MNKEEILNCIKDLVGVQGFYGRLYNKLSDKSEESEKILQELEDQKFKDKIDLILFLEC